MRRAATSDQVSFGLFAQTKGKPMRPAQGSAKSTTAALDYDSTIYGALELSDKKWVLAVQLPGVDRHSRHLVEADIGKLMAWPTCPTRY